MSPSEPWPPKGGPTTVVVPRPAILSLSSSITIAAPAPLVLSVLRAVSDYGAWNEFCPEVHINSQPSNVAEGEREILHVGTSFTEEVIMDSKHPNHKNPMRLRVTEISTPEHPSHYVPQSVLDSDGGFEKDQTIVHRISWTGDGGWIAIGLKTERVNEIIDLEMVHVNTDHGKIKVDSLLGL